MAANDLEINGENDLLEVEDGYQSANAAQGVGGTTTASETFDRVGTAASEFNDAGARPIDAAQTSSAANRAMDFDDAEMNDDSPLKWIVPLIILALLIIIGYAFCGKS